MTGDMINYKSKTENNVNIFCIRIGTPSSVLLYFFYQ